MYTRFTWTKCVREKRREEKKDNSKQTHEQAVNCNRKDAAREREKSKDAKKKKRTTGKGRRTRKAGKLFPHLAKSCSLSNSHFLSLFYYRFVEKSLRESHSVLS